MPGLNFPVRADTSQFDQAMDRARNTTSQATRYITQTFVKTGQDIIAASAAGTAAMTSDFLKTQAAAAASALAIRLAWVAAYGLAAHEIIQLIGTVREQMQQVVELADKAAGAGTTPEFWQAFISGARNGRIEVEALEQALEHAGNVTKDKLDPKWTVWEDGAHRATTEVEKLMLDMRELFTVGQNFSGLQLFRDARDTQDRVRAVLTYMVQLQAIGQDLAALELGEKMFGTKFVDNIRHGNTSAQQMLDALKNAPDWTNEVVARAKDIDVALKSATDHLSREMHPAFESLVDVGNQIKAQWASIVEWIASAAGFINRIDQIAEKYGLGGDLMGRAATALGAGAVNKALGSPGGTSGELSPEASLSLQRFRPSQGFDEAGFGGGQNIPLPRRRPSDAPKPPKASEAAEETDAFESATDAINRQIAALTADAAAIGKTAAEHQQLRIEMRLLEAARQSGVEITDEQISQYAQLRASMGAEQALAATGIQLDKDQADQFVRLSQNIRLVTTALDDKKRAFQGVSDSVRFAGNELVDVIDRATQKGANFGQIMSDVFRNIAKQALQAAITGEGAFAKLFGTASTTGGVGGIGGLIAGLFKGSAGGPTNMTGIAGDLQVPTYADGGLVPPNTTFIYAEHSAGGPRVGRTGSDPIMVTPGDVTPPRSSGGGSTIHMPISIDARGAQIGAAEMIEVAVRRAVAEVPGAVANMRRFDHRALR